MIATQPVHVPAVNIRNIRTRYLPAVFKVWRAPQRTGKDERERRQVDISSKSVKIPLRIRFLNGWRSAPDEQPVAKNPERQTGGDYEKQLRDLFPGCRPGEIVPANRQQEQAEEAEPQCSRTAGEEYLGPQQRLGDPALQENQRCRQKQQSDDGQVADPTRRSISPGSFPKRGSHYTRCGLPPCPRGRSFCVFHSIYASDGPTSTASSMHSFGFGCTRPIFLPVPPDTKLRRKQPRCA